MGLQTGAVVDADGKAITSQDQSGSQTLDVGINVAGTQIDPRQTRALTTGTDSVTVGASALPTGAATDTKQDTGNTSLSAIAVSAASADTKLSSQATAAKQDTGNISLAAIAAGTPTSLGQKASTASQSVVLASDQPAIATKGASGGLTDRSGTTSGTLHTSTQMMAANANRKYLFIQNVGTNPIWINFTTVATESQPSIQITAGASFAMEAGFVSIEVVNVVCNHASNPFTAKEG